MAGTLFTDEASHDSARVAADRRARKFARMERAAAGGLQSYCRGGCWICTDSATGGTAASDCKRDGGRSPWKLAPARPWERLILRNIPCDGNGAGGFFFVFVFASAGGWLHAEVRRRQRMR